MDNKILRLITQALNDKVYMDKKHTQAPHQGDIRCYKKMGVKQNIKKLDFFYVIIYFYIWTVVYVS